MIGELPMSRKLSSFMTREERESEEVWDLFVEEVDDAWCIRCSHPKRGVKIALIDGRLGLNFQTIWCAVRDIRTMRNVREKASK